VKRITVLVSGRGSNLAALVEATRGADFPGAVTAVIGNSAKAPGLAFARAQGIATTLVDPSAYATRKDFDRALGEAIDASEPDLVILAGFMRVLGRELVERYAGRMLNIHPSLLPAYPGLDTHARALAGGVRIHGCTVHFVSPAVDGGPIVAQAAVPVHDGDDEATLAARVLAQEHRLLPAAARWFCAGRLALHGGRARMQDGVATTGSLAVPSP
jgi:phosphoribosylglycinamide formyltransferase-1